MQDGIYYCPLCKGKVLSTVTETLNAGESSLAPEEKLSSVVALLASQPA
jgi:hypothetical protein